MATKFTLSFILILSLLTANAQITLSSSDMPAAGWAEIQGIDSLSSVNYGNAGASQVYDFSSLSPVNHDTLEYTAPDSAQSAEFPNSNLVFTSDHVNFILADNSNSNFDYTGIIGSVAGINSYVNFSPGETIYNFPLTYGNAFTGNWGFVKAILNTNPGLEFDSIVVAFVDTFYDTIDGWGQVITPVGTYNGLREARKNYTHTTITGVKISPPINATIENLFDSTFQFTFLAKETKGPVVSFDLDSLGNLRDAKYSLIPPDTTTGIETLSATGVSIYPNPGNQNVIIDMRNNHNLITSGYTSIELYNLLGEKVVTYDCNNSLGLANLPVGQLSSGMYYAVLTSSNNAITSLGKFIVAH